MPPKRSAGNKSAAGNQKKRKADDAADHDGSPPKEKVYRYYCKAENCTKWAQKGGVCWKHGGKKELKRCSVEKCANLARNGGVCMRHGAKVKKCRFERCEKFAVNGGVCMKHGAKVKRCGVEGCAKQANNGGLCWKHGGKRELKRCRVDGCEKQAQNGGVCYEHGATRKIYLCRFPNCTNKVRKGGVCYRHGATNKMCRFPNCTKQVRKGGVCWRHRHYVPPPQGNNNMLCGVIEDGGNQHNASAVVEISDNEEGGNDGNESPFATRKRMANGANQTERGLSIEENVAVDEMEQDVSESKDNADKSKSNHDDPRISSVDRRGVNMKDDTEKDPSEIELQKENAEGGKSVNDNEEEKEEAPDAEPVADGDDGEGGGNFETGGNQEDLTLNDVRKNEGINVAFTNDGKEEEDEGGGMSEKEKDHGDNHLVDDDHYEFDAGYDNNGDVFSESHVVPEEIVAAGPSGNEIDRDTEIQGLTAELEKERNQSEHVADKYESVKSQLQVKEEHIQSLNNDIEEMIGEVEEVNADKAAMETQLTQAATARLQERVDKEAAYRDVERLEAEKEELTEQLKEARSNFEAAETFWNARRETKKMLETEGANVELRREVRDLKRDNAALKGQAANAKMMEMRANGRANLAMLEVLRLEREKDEVQAANEVLRGTVEELRETNEALCNNQFKFKLSSRMKKQERENRTI